MAFLLVSAVLCDIFIGKRASGGILGLNPTSN